MPVELNDKRTSPSSISTGTPVQPVSDGDDVHVKPRTTYLEGSRHVGPHSEPYRVPRHHANELKAQGFADIVEPTVAAEASVDADDAAEDEDEVEVIDDASRVPEPDQTTASTVPALPGAEPVRPDPGPIPPAAVSDAPQPARRGPGRPPKPKA